MVMDIVQEVLAQRMVRASGRYMCRNFSHSKSLNFCLIPTKNNHNFPTLHSSIRL